MTDNRMFSLPRVALCVPLSSPGSQIRSLKTWHTYSITSHLAAHEVLCTDIQSNLGFSILSLHITMIPNSISLPSPFYECAPICADVHSRPLLIAYTKPIIYILEDWRFFWGRTGQYLSQLKFPGPTRLIRNQHAHRCTYVTWPSHDACLIYLRDAVIWWS